MEWALTGLPGTEDLIEYEIRVNYVIPKYEDTVVCTYDLTKFGASAAMDALRTHPFVIIGGLVQENLNGQPSASNEYRLILNYEVSFRGGKRR